MSEVANASSKLAEICNTDNLTEIYGDLLQ